MCFVDVEMSKQPCIKTARRDLRGEEKVKRCYYHSRFRILPFSEDKTNLVKTTSQKRVAIAEDAGGAEAVVPGPPCRILQPQNARSEEGGTMYTEFDCEVSKLSWS